MKTTLLIPLLLLIPSCAYLKQHPEVVEEAEKDVELVVEEIATDIIKAELEAK